MSTATTGYQTRVGLGEIADVAATHAILRTASDGYGGRTVVCECRKQFTGYSEHAFHIAQEAITYASGRTLDPMAAFDHKYGKDDL